MKMLVVNRKMLLSILMMVVLIYVPQGVSYARVCQVGDVIAPGESCTYVAGEANVTFSVNADGEACRSGGPAVTKVFGIPVRIERIEDFCRNDDIARDDTFNSNFAASKNADLSWMITGVPAVEPAEEANNTGGVDPQPDPSPKTEVPRSEDPGVDVTPTLTLSTPHTLTEITLDGSVVTLILSGGTYEQSIFDIRDAVTVSGIDGVEIPWHQPDRKSDTQITVALEFDGSMDADARLTFTVGADAIANYTGAALTATLDVLHGEPGSLQGPWLWMIVPTPAVVEQGIIGQDIATEIDSLAAASRGALTEAHVAKNGINEGDSIGGSQWTSGWIYWDGHRCKTYDLRFCIDPRVCWENNVSNLANALGIGAGLGSERTAYAVINLISPAEQKGVILKAESGDALKIWLNGTAVHSEAVEHHNCRKVDVPLACDPRICVPDPAVQETKETQIPVTLNAGNNFLMVKVQQHGEYWGMKLELAATFTTELPTITASITPPVIAEDVNGDGVVDAQDLTLVAASIGKTGQTPADVNTDGIVNITDLLLVAAVLDADAAAPSLYRDSFERMSVSDVRQWLSEARGRDMTDPSVRKGILFLEQLLASRVPKETVLLANYPNPFNPETWIPYQLSKSADVMLTIYASNGQVVRRLAPGPQAAGEYQSRSRAAYWNGRNAFGEPVASGLYFYTLKAGDFTATRKMLIRK